MVTESKRYPGYWRIVEFAIRKSRFPVLLKILSQIDSPSRFAAIGFCAQAKFTLASPLYVECWNRGSTKRWKIDTV